MMRSSSAASRVAKTLWRLISTALVHGGLLHLLQLPPIVKVLVDRPAVGILARRHLLQIYGRAASILGHILLSIMAYGLLTIAMFGGLAIFTVGCYLLTGWGG